MLAIGRGKNRILENQKTNVSAIYLSYDASNLMTFQPYDFLPYLMCRTIYDDIPPSFSAETSEASKVWMFLF